MDVDRLASLTGYPVRTEYKAPQDPDVPPPADVCVVLTARTEPCSELPDRHEDFPWDALFDDVVRRWPA